MQVLEGEVRLHDAGGFDSGPEDILLSRDVGRLGYPVQVVQVAENERGREGGKRREREQDRKPGGRERERQEEELSNKFPPTRSQR